MMMSERRDDPECGLLLYLRNSSLAEVKAGIHEMRGLVQLRNELCFHLRTHGSGGEADGNLMTETLPEPLNLRRACAQCPHLVACTLQQKLSPTEIPSAPHAMSELVPQTLSHLSDTHLQFYQKWSLMSSLEKQESAAKSKLNYLWCKTPDERQKLKLCLAFLTLEEKNPASPNVHSFTRNESLDTMFQTGESVILSTDQDLAVAQGIVVSTLNKRKITLALDRSLEDTSKHYHVDRYEYQGSMSGSFINLIKLMSSSPEAQRLRNLVIDRAEARFVKGLPRQVVDVGKHILRPLNKCQQKAIFKVLMAQDYALLRGMPGTGKTTLITGKGPL